MNDTRSFEAPPTGEDFVYLAAFQQLVLERSHDLITVVDVLGSIVYASPSWQSILGWNPDSLLGTSALELVHPDDREAVRERLDANGVELLPGGRLEFRDPSGNMIQVVQYDQVRFLKDERVLRALGLELGKADSALDELREHGVE